MTSGGHEEPPRRDNQLLGRLDVILTPHSAADTVEARAAIGEAALNDLLAVLDGQPSARGPTPMACRGGGRREAPARASARSSRLSRGADELATICSSELRLCA
jgi:hypothetical protein